MGLLGDLRIKSRLKIDLKLTLTDSAYVKQDKLPHYFRPTAKEMLVNQFLYFPRPCVQFHLFSVNFYGRIMQINEAHTLVSHTSTH